MAEVEVEENAAEDLSIPASEIVTALRTRPSLLLRGSRAGNSVGINRSSSLPHSGTTGRERRLHLRRSCSEENLTPYALYGDVQVEIPPSNQGRRRITVKLKERIQDQIERQAAAVNNSIWEYFTQVKWPKLKRKLKAAASYELWKDHLRQVEGSFGSAVLSYFIFLRWLFLVNLAVFTIWISVVCIPQFIWETTEGANTKPNYRLACAYRSSAQSNCSDGYPTTHVYSLDASSSSSNCSELYSNDSFPIRTCTFEDHVAESSTLITVWSVLNCSAVTTWNVCSTDIHPYLPWYQYLVDFITGRGVFNQTVLFLGRYTNATVIGNRNFNMPLVTLVTAGVVYAISFVVLVYKIGQAHNESYLSFWSSRQVNYCNKVFSLWDYSITDPRAVRLKKENNRTSTVEELKNEEKRQKKRTMSELARIFAIRACTNTLVTLVLIGAWIAIFEAAKWNLNISVQKTDPVTQALNSFVVPVVITTFNNVMPFLLAFVARVEKFKTKRGEIRMTLLRAILVRVTSLVVLIITDYTLIKCTQKVGAGVQGGADECSLQSTLRLPGGGGYNDTMNQDCNVECWETFIGQDFYRLALTNGVISVVSTLAFETALKVAQKLIYPKLRWDLFTKGTFNIPKSILDLIYTQLLLWLGFLFSPLQPVVIILTIFITFYVKKYSLVWNLEPEKRGIFKAARTNFLFLLLLLMALLWAIALVGYATAQLLPSSSCGPFRSKVSMIQVINDLTESIESCNAKLALSFVQSTAFFVFIIAILLIVIYALSVRIQAYKARFELIKDQLVLEVGDMAHIVGKMSSMLEKRLKQRQQALTTQPPGRKRRAPAKEGTSAHGSLNMSQQPHSMLKRSKMPHIAETCEL